MTDRSSGAAIQVCLLLGSNIDPEVNMPRAVLELCRHFRLLGVSKVWETPPVQGDGPNFLNAAVLVETDFEPERIKMEVIRPLETQLGRTRTADKHAPRTIDIDVVIWGEHTIDPQLWEFAHVAVPAAELLPELRSPTGDERLADAAARLRLGALMFECEELSLKGCLTGLKPPVEPDPDAANS